MYQLLIDFFNITGGGAEPIRSVMQPDAQPSDERRKGDQIIIIQCFSLSSVLYLIIVIETSKYFKGFLYINKTQIKSNGLEIYIVEYNRHSPPRKSIQTTRDPSHRSTERAQRAAVCPTWLHSPTHGYMPQKSLKMTNLILQIEILLLHYRY